MTGLIDLAALRPLQQTLNQHPIYENLHTLADLQLFMQHHVYSVWDFMSVVKYLQQHVAPTQVPWTPKGDGSIRRFINELVLEEESDRGIPNEAGEETFSSHFELYCRAMQEIGADTQSVVQFIQTVQEHGVTHALAQPFVPAAARQFSHTTFQFIAQKKPHVVAAALALGREHIIPQMFREFLKKMQITPQQAPIFHYYLNRHIHLDEDFHAPLSLRLLQALCGQVPEKIAEAEQAAQHALQARITFWDGVLAVLQQKRGDIPA
jgi:pyrroloquinoline quinone (PQQ) biosynthesis protein C